MTNVEFGGSSRRHRLNQKIARPSLSSESDLPIRFLQDEAAGECGL